MTGLFLRPKHWQFFKDEAFEIVYSHLSVHYFTQKITKQIFSEIYRVLKPKGIVAILVNSTFDPEYGTGMELEEDYFEIDSVRKRFFKVDSMKSFVQEFQVIVLDNLGATYKDRTKGVSNLIRFVGKK